MKTLNLFLLVMLGCVTTLFAQEDDKQVTFGLYRWTSNVPMKQCDRDGNNIGSKVDAEAGQLFRVVEILNDDVVIKILNYTKVKGGGAIITNPLKFEKFNFSKPVAQFKTLDSVDQRSMEFGDQQRYFRVPKSYVLSSASKWYGRNGDLTVGVLTLPLKLRLKDGDFTGSFTVGGAGGWKFRASHYKDRYHNVLLGLGISNITLDSNTVSKNKDKLVSNLTALTAAIGYMYQSGKFQAGIFVGKDFLSHDNQERFDWRYQGKPWISLAFGLSIFGEGKKDNDEKKNTQD